MKVPAAVLDQGGVEHQRWVIVAQADIHEVLEDFKGQGFLSWSFLTCVDHLDSRAPHPDRYELIYQLRNQSTGEMIRVRSFLPESAPSALTVSDLYPPANWDERETFDLFGIDFVGHPGLTRILLPDDWVGHPLRRDFPVGGEPVEFSEDIEIWQTAPEKA